MNTRLQVQHHAAPLRQQVVQVLRSEILEGSFAPGERLLENALCERYGVSRTVVREALRQLESESLITLRPNRGPIVTILSEKDIESLYEVRRALEGLMGELFTVNASQEQLNDLATHFESMEQTYRHGDVASRGQAKDRFYELMLDGAGNDVLEASLMGVHTRIGIFRHYAFVDEARVALTMDELAVIVTEAVVNRNPELARAACEEHIRIAGRLATIEYKNRLATAAASLA